MHRSIYDHQQHPKALQPVLPEIRAFAEQNHFNVLFPVLRLLALGLELPEDTFVNIHGFEAKGETYGQCFSRCILFDPSSRPTSHIKSDS